ncbi:MAG: hypothetical protein J6T70_11195 [Bacteroidales bacterium]|nr:hypothetical protein [Bacteroidales bacterium]
MTKRDQRLVRQAIFAGLIITAFNSCSDKELSDTFSTIETNNIVDNYYVPGKMLATTSEIENNIILLNWSRSYGDYARDNFDLASQIYNYQTTNKTEYNRYIDYAKYYGDTVYNKWHNLSEIEWISVMPLISVDITSDKEFDANHPANSNINDLCTFVDYGNNIYAFIHDTDENGVPLYKGRNGNLLLHDSQYYNVNEIKTNPIIMPSESNYIRFDKLPEKNGTYNITISIKFGPDPITGQETEIEPVTVEMKF